MGPQVGFQVAPLCEPLVTEVTLEGLFTCVGPLMVLEKELVAEWLLTELAKEQITRVDPLVVVEAVLLRERLATDVAGKRLVS